MRNGNISAGIWYVFNSFLWIVLESKFNRAVAVVIVESEIEQSDIINAISSNQVHFSDFAMSFQ